ncbi:hypothetical protein HN51_071701 [Arachis hypogaea]
MKFQWRGDGNWKWLWEIFIPKKVIFFFWLALHDAIPTNVFCHKRDLAVSDLCNKCGNEPESVLHCLRDCSTVRDVWNSLDPSIVEHANISDFRSWITSVINVISQNILKVNYDAGIFSDSLVVGFECVIRDHYGTWVLGSSGRMSFDLVFRQSKMVL